MNVLKEIATSRWLLRAAVFLPTLLLIACGGGSRPEVPTLDKPVLSTSSEPGAVELSWPSVKGATHFEVQRCDAPCGAAADSLSNCTAVSSVTAAASLATDLPPSGKAFCYRAQACTDASKATCSGFGTPASGAVLTVAGVTDPERKIWSGQPITLSAFAKDASGTPTFQWVQESGPKVALDNPAAATVNFTAPALTGATNDLVSFKVNVTDAKGAGQATKVAVTIHPLEKLAVSAGARVREVTAGGRVSLHASATGAVTPGFTWTQVAPTSPSIVLEGANTANARFTAPSGIDSNFQFKVDYRDITTGGSASDTVTVAVRQPASMPTGQPLAVPAVSTAVAPPPMVLTAPADAFAVAGTTTRLTMAVAGGSRSYAWSWIQTGGTPATLSGQGQSVLTVNVPNVTAPEVLTFRAQVTDSAGARLDGTARVQILPAPLPNVPTPPLQQVVVRPRPTVHATAGAPTTVRSSLSGVTVVQTGGSLAQVSTTSASGITTITITPPSIVTSSESLQFTITGTNSNNETVREIVPVVVNRAPGQAQPPVAPPLVQAPVPPLLQPLAIVSCGAARANEGQRVDLGACVSGGSGNYTYSWTYRQQPGGPAITLNDATTSHPNVALPGVTTETGLRFDVTVRDGALVATAPIFLVVSDIAASLHLGALADLAVDTGNPVTLTVPNATGGVPPYSWTIRQTEGPTLALPSGSNPTFTPRTPPPGSQQETYKFEFALTDAAGNKALVTQNLAVRIPALTLTPSMPACVVQEVATAVSATVAGGVGPYTYSWTSPELGDARHFQPPNMASSTLTLPNTREARAGQFSVEVVANDSRGARASSGLVTLHYVPVGGDCSPYLPNATGGTCVDTFLGNCTVDFDGMCDIDFVKEQCQLTCGGCAAPAPPSSLSSVLRTTNANKSQRLKTLVAPR